jgi:hypothetical protein
MRSPASAVQLVVLGVGGIISSGHGDECVGGKECAGFIEDVRRGGVTVVVVDETAAVAFILRHD